MSVTDQDKGAKALLARLKEAKGLTLTVGVHDTEGALPHEEPPTEGEGSGDSSTPPTVAQIATVHEYGLGDNPERSWLRAWADTNQAKNEDTLTKIAQAVFEGKFTAEQGLERAGLRFVAEIQQGIKAHIPPPLKPETIARKKSSTPLINTGQFWGSIRHRVNKR